MVLEVVEKASELAVEGVHDLYPHNVEERSDEGGVRGVEDGILLELVGGRHEHAEDEDGDGAHDHPDGHEEEHGEPERVQLALLALVDFNHLLAWRRGRGGGEGQQRVKKA